MTKPAFIAELEAVLGLPLQDMTEVEPIWKVVEHLAFLHACMDGREAATADDLQRAALERLNLSVCQNTYLCDAEGVVVGLNLFGNGLTRLPLTDHAGWRALQVLQIAENKLTELTLPAAWTALQSLDLGDNATLRSLRFDGPLPALERLDAGDSGLEHLVVPTGMTALHTLDVSRNKLRSVVFEGDCPELEWLDLSGNALSSLFLPEGFQQMTHMYLGDNENMQQLAFTEALSRLEVLQVANCDLAELPQETILNGKMTSLYAANNTPKNIPYIFLSNDRSHNCLEKARVWFDELRKAPVEKNKQVKLMLLGNGSAGKSTLLCALENGGRCTCEKKHTSTHGVEMKTLPQNDVVYNIWDFGGQEIYHGTHRLFMQSPAVQLILFVPLLENYAVSGEQRKDPVSDELIYDHPVEYWFETATSLSEKSRFVFVQNKRDEEPEENDRIRKYARENGAEYVHISALEGTDVDILEKRMENLAKRLPDYDMVMPSSWIAVRHFFVDNLRGKEPRKTITRDDFNQLCLEHKVDEEIRPLLFDYLRHSGFLYYHEKLGETIITDQKWALNAIYKFFDRDKPYYKEWRRRSDGQIPAERIFDIFGDDYTEKEKELFLSFMESCGICFKMNTEDSNENLSASDVYIFPEFLPPNINPVADQDWQERTREVCTFEYPLAWTNRYLIDTFIARLGRKTPVQYFWRNGIQVQTKDGWFRVTLSHDPKVLSISIERQAVAKWLKSILEALPVSESEQWRVTAGGKEPGETLNLEVWLRGDRQMPSTPDAEEQTPSATAPLEALPNVDQEANVRRVLFLSANPSATRTVQYRNEFYFISERYEELADHLFQLTLKPVSNVTVERFLDAARERKPHILHFVGHGKEIELPDGERDTQLIFHDDDFREMEMVDSGKMEHMLTKLISEAGVPLKVVFLNACLTAAMAARISKAGGGLHVVGSNAEIFSSDARRFAARFYTAFCQNGDLVKAVREGFWAAPEAEAYIRLYYNGDEISLKNTDK